MRVQKWHERLDEKNFNPYDFADDILFEKNHWVLSTLLLDTYGSEVPQWVYDEWTAKHPLYDPSKRKPKLNPYEKQKELAKNPMNPQFGTGQGVQSVRGPPKTSLATVL